MCTVEWSLVIDEDFCFFKFFNVLAILFVSMKKIIWVEFGFDNTPFHVPQGRRFLVLSK